ncbi:beta strand repeat-containing protein [Dokdonella sp. MW10]|uniref:beta strand repeat-containing protein n=1 Tax=Dokdonella sp. MW10 TaxID=2992926 RepID=UPI003F7E6A86
MDAHTIEAPCQASPSRIAVGRSRRRGFSRALACVAGAFLFGAVAHAAPLTIPNGDFSHAGNHGSVGGSLLGGAATTLIGAGPWSASYAGALNTLAQPTVTVGGGHVEVTGLLGIDVLGIINNHAHIHQDTGIAWVANRRYVLSADVNANALLGLSLLTSGNAGVALSTGPTSASRVISSIQPGATLTLLNGTTYRVSVEYTTGASVSGTIHTHLFAEPSGLLTAQLLGTVAFDNVTLTTHLINPVPASVVPASPGPFTGTVGQPITPPIAITVLDALGDAIPGVSVSFTTPSSGASATVTPNPATTNANGVASVTTTANTIAGSYQITANIAGVPTPLVFNMVNAPGPVAGAGPISGGGQSAVAGQPFSGPIGFAVQDAFGNAVPGVQVTFSAPSSGASATFSPSTVTSGANGLVTTTATANTIAGTYNVTVSVAGVATPITFPLTNSAGPAAGIGPITGGGQSAAADQPFSGPISFIVRDAFDNAVPGVQVTFSAPSSGASATFNPATVTSSPTGQVTTNARANTIAGTYNVTVSIAGIATPITFPLTNTAGPAAAIDAPSGSGQTPITGQPFAAPLGLRVLDAFGNVVPGAIVTFSAPSTGASAALSPTSVTTGVNGTATTTAIANGIAGEYHITASIAGLGPVAQYAATNMLDPSIDPDPAGETTLNGSLGGLFSCVLLVHVTDAQDNPLQGLEVDFTAPISGPTATLTDGNSSGFSVRTTTDEDGFAWVEATGNGVAGSYTVNAQLRYSSQAAIPFHLRNLDALDPVFNAGFDGTCIPAVGLLQAQQNK